MKKIKLVILIVFCCWLSVKSQSIPNNGFETWSMGGPFETADGWANSPAASKSTDAHSGSFAIRLRTDTFTNPMTSTLDTILGRANTGTMGMGPGTGTNGYGFTSRPDSLIGWYKYTPVGSDGWNVRVNLSKWNSTTSTSDIIGTATFIGNASATYTRFSVAINYTSASLPDTANIELNCGDPMMRVIGNSLLIDDLAFITNSTGMIPENKSNTETLELYPNPSNNLLMVSNVTGDYMILKNMLGETLKTYETKGMHEIMIDVSSYKSGLYLITDNHGNDSKLIIQH